MFGKSELAGKTATIAVLAYIFILAVPSYLAGEEASITFRRGEITHVVGEASIKKAGEDAWIKAFPGFLLSQYDIIKTRGDASVDVEFSKKDGKYFKIRLRDESELSFTRLEADDTSRSEDILMDLAIGELLIKTDKLSPKSKFRVRTPTSIVGVKGTRFEVRYGKLEE